MTKIQFPIVARFIILSVLCVVALALVLGFTLSSFLTRAVSEWESENTAAFVRREMEEAGVAPLFAAPRGPETDARWQDALARVATGLPGVVRCQVWSREQTIIWSDDPTLIGRQFPGNLDLQAALAGSVVAAVKELGKDEHANVADFSMLAEVYVPILSKPGEVLGVVEVYKVPTKLFSTLRWGLTVIWAISLAGGAALCLVVLPLVKRLYVRPSRDAGPPWAAESARPAEEIKAEIEERFGFFPPFFAPAMESPSVLSNLWQQTLSAYVNNPLPALFKEKLFAYLSRYCAVPYCIVCHSCALRPLGMTAAEVLALLDSPPPTETDVIEELTLLAAESAPLRAWPEPGSFLETALLHCSVFVFLHPDRSERCQAELRRLLGPAHYSHLSEFLAYVKTCHVWVETHPELAYHADKRAQEHLGPLIEREPRLLEFFRDYGERVKRERQRREEQRIAELEARAAALEATNDALRARIAGRGLGETDRP